MGEEMGAGGETTDGRGRWVGGGNGCVFRGCLAGDLLEEWIQKSLLFVEAQFRDILGVKCQAPTVTRKQEVHPSRTQAG